MQIVSIEHCNCYDLIYVYSSADTQGLIYEQSPRLMLGHDRQGRKYRRYMDSHAYLHVAGLTPNKALSPSSLWKFEEWFPMVGSG